MMTKFRCWYESKMHNVRVVSWNQDGSLRYIDLYGHTEIPEKQKCNLMQFIGYRDKNEREIYEGDIVAIPYISNGRPGVFVTVICCISVIHPNTHLGEVIGNVYENPELVRLMDDAQFCREKVKHANR